MMERLKDDDFSTEDNAVDSFFLELRAGTGGDEAALGRDLYEMYRKYCEAEAMSDSMFRIFQRRIEAQRIQGSDHQRARQRAFIDILRFEGGGHRVQQSTGDRGGGGEFPRLPRRWRCCRKCRM